jgi:hypothetical protein
MGVISVDKVRVGQVVRFDYRGGERPGYRLVEVSKNENGYLKGNDQEKAATDAYRQYRYDRINSVIELVADVHEQVISPASFLVNVNVPVEQAASVYKMLNPDRAATVRVSNGLIIARRTDLPRIDVAMSATGVVIEFTSTTGERVGIKMKHQDSSVKDAVISCTPSPADYDTFVRLLFDQRGVSPALTSLPSSPNPVSDTRRVFEIDSKGTAEVKSGTRWEDLLKNRALVGINKQI